jgi:hypothetical protein
MRKWLAIALVLILMPAIPTSNAETNLIDVGIVENIDSKFVHTSFTSSSTILTLTNEGNLSEHFWGSGQLITQWSLELNTTVNSATMDSSGNLVAIAAPEGAFVVNIIQKTITRTLNSTNSVDYVLWDAEGDLWLAHYGGERRAKEHGISGLTGMATEPHNTALTSLALISDNRIVTGGRDNLVKVSDQNGTVLHTLSDFSSYPTKIINDGNGNIIVGCVNGDLFRYSFSDWTKEELSIDSGQSILSITMTDDNKILVGTQNGKLHVIDETNFTELRSFSSPGRVIIANYGVDGELYVISTFSSSSKIRLFDIDTDGDSVTDSLDDFPEDSTQSTDSDGDGYGDNINGNSPDYFPDDGSQWSDADGDGYGDNPEGNDSDAFIDNAEQWLDTDGDGYGDNLNGLNGDRFPTDPTQWVDSDYDGFGDEIDGTNGDHCPNQNGFSTEDRIGCKDSDNDGYSDPTDDWTIEDGADFKIYDKSQWRDSDGDGYGDNLSGNDPDSCPLDWGNSTNAYVPEVTGQGSLTFQYVVIEKFGCLDSDGDGFYDAGDDLPNDARDYIDEDGDLYGMSIDFNDSNKLVQTSLDHCTYYPEDNSEICQGVRDSDYQNYLSKTESNGESADSYYTWRQKVAASEAENDDADSYINTAMEILPYLGGGFAVMIVVLLILATVSKARKRSKLVKQYGMPFVPGEGVAEKEALEGKAGLSAKGGVESDKYWEDEIEPMDLETTNQSENGGFDDIDVREGKLEQSTDVMEESSSIEELAGLPPQSTAEDLAISNESPADLEEPVSPPIPESGLPEGWTMEQWKWYGAEWLSRQK